MTPGDAEIQGHLIEDRAYCRVRDLAEALGYKVLWQPGIVTVSEKPREIGPDTDLRLPSLIDDYTLDKYMNGTPLMGLGRSMIEAARKWRVNAVFICAVACHESDFGRSAIARNRRNLFGIMAYDADPYAYAKKYDSYQAGIEDFCRLLSREYLNPAGSFYHGPTVVGVGKCYASDPNWAEKVLRHCREILKGE